MAQVVEERENSRTRMSDFPRDLLKRFMSMNHHHHHELQQQQHRHGDGDADQEIELSLGLSMNGHFGVDPTAKKIKRTTSIPKFSFSKPLIRDEDNNNSNNNNQDIGGYSNNMPMPCTTNLIRTCSLPTETEEEWRKRKELQTLRRLEARRKRFEKQQRNVKAMRKKSNRSSSSFSEDIAAFVDENNSNLVEATLNEFSSLGRKASLSTSVAIHCHITAAGKQFGRKNEKGPDRCIFSNLEDINSAIEKLRTKSVHFVNLRDYFRV